MPFHIFCAALLALSLANLAYLLGYSPWYGLLLLLPLAVVYGWRRDWYDPVVYRSSQVLLGLCALSVVALLFNKLLQDLPLVIDRLFPVSIAMMALYLLSLYLREGRMAQQGEPQQRLQNAFLGPPAMLSLGVAVVLAVYTLLALVVSAERWDALGSVTERFTSRGIIPPLTLVFFFWATVLLVVKRAVLYTRLRNLDWMAAAPAVQGDAYRPYMEALWRNSNESYLIPKYINWSIPILGFIGTVLGISLAAAGIQGVISSQQGLSEFSSNLGDAISPLGIAFDTTLIALSLSIVLTLMQTLQQRWEDRVLAQLEERLSAEA